MSDARELTRWAARLHKAAGGELRRVLQRELVGVALEAEGRAKDNATTGPMARTGALRRSIAGTVAATPEGLRLVLSAGGRTGGSDLRYAALQEYGGVIRPVNKKWLTIPVGAAKTRAGVTRGGARMFPDLRFQPSKNAPNQKAYLVRDVGRGKTARSEILFVLVKRSQIRPKRYLARAWEQVPADAAIAMQAATTQVLQGAAP